MLVLCYVLKYFVCPPNASLKDRSHSQVLYHTFQSCVGVLYTLEHLKRHQTPELLLRFLYSQNIWRKKKKIYLLLMWNSESNAASKLLGKCLCGRLGSPGHLIIQVRDLVGVQSGCFPACTTEFLFPKSNCSHFQRNI